MHLVMFDIDGTLIQSNQADTKCYLAALSTLGIHAVNKDVSSYPHVTDASIATEILSIHHQRPAESRDIATLRQHYLEHLTAEATANPDGFQLIPGAQQAFETLYRQTDTAVALATGAWEPTARLKLAQSGFDMSDQIPFASSSDALSRESIMTLAYQRAKRTYNQTGFESITYVGDATWDVRASRQLGYQFIGICAQTQTDKLHQEGARITLENYHNLNRFLSTLQDLQSGRASSFTSARQVHV